MVTNNRAASQGGGKPAAAVVAALVVVYVVWGTTYLAIRVAVETIPPLLMGGVRFLIAGGGLYLALRARGIPAPSVRQWRSAAIVGSLMWAVGNGSVAIAEQSVASGLSAVVVASVPLWAALYAGLWGEWPGRAEWAGLVLGASGVLLLSTGSELGGDPRGAAILVMAAASFALGSVWSHRLELPPGLMGSATVMLTASPLLLTAGTLAGERVTRLPSAMSLAALVYLIVFGAIVGASAYLYLLRAVRPALATSYAFVNPIIAVIVGNLIAGERVSGVEIAAMAAILVAVGLVMSGRRRSVPAPSSARAPLVDVNRRHGATSSVRG